MYTVYEVYDPVTQNSYDITDEIHKAYDSLGDILSTMVDERQRTHLRVRPIAVEEYWMYCGLGGMVFLDHDELERFMAQYEEAPVIHHKPNNAIPIWCRTFLAPQCP